MASAGLAMLGEGALVLAVQPLRERTVPEGDPEQLVANVCAPAAGTPPPAIPPDVGRT
jgi:hypothetical protein